MAEGADEVERVKSNTSSSTNTHTHTHTNKLFSLARAIPHKDRDALLTTQGVRSMTCTGRLRQKMPIARVLGAPENATMTLSKERDYKRLVGKSAR